MKNTIKKILNEEFSDGVKRPYKFHVGGYLIESEDYSNNIVLLTKEEFENIKKINDSCKTMYELHKEKLELLIQHNKGVIMKSI